ncbi:hypothetical protein T10_7172 [Trichinella papuae]|uniref:Reverse transcriptase domain-containing protein n=1 Tax=Trichinella papuae TaxID=268474 RepID=A0A0V1M1T7_9BILA|nr:hypothetical protein T10_7172 [Trichinella papuae]
MERDMWLGSYGQQGQCTCQTTARSPCDLNCGWAEGVDGKPGPPERTWYLPHHAVYQDSQGKTECRVVFDGSAEWNGTSLNSCLDPGPKLQPVLVPPPHFVRPGAVCPQQLCTLFFRPGAVFFPTTPIIFCPDRSGFLSNNSAPFFSVPFPTSPQQFPYHFVRPETVSPQQLCTLFFRPGAVFFPTTPIIFCPARVGFPPNILVRFFSAPFPTSPQQLPYHFVRPGAVSPQQLCTLFFRPGAVFSPPTPLPFCPPQGGFSPNKLVRCFSDALTDRVLSDMYVDDLATICDGVNEARQLVQRLTELMQTGGFALKKWASNDPDALTDLPPEDVSSADEGRLWKTLGLHWNRHSDHLTFLPLPDIRPERHGSKRQLLSLASRLFDPLGCLAFFTMRAKRLF